MATPSASADVMNTLMQLVNSMAPRERRRKRAPVAEAAAELYWRYTRRHPEAGSDPTAVVASFFIAAAYDAITRADAPQLAEFGEVALRFVSGDARQLSAAVAGITTDLAVGGVLSYVLQKHVGGRAVEEWGAAYEALRAHDAHGAAAPVAAHAPHVAHCTAPPKWEDVADLCAGFTTLDECPHCSKSPHRALLREPPVDSIWDVIVALNNEVGAQHVPAVAPASSPAVALCAHDIVSAFAAQGGSATREVIAAAYLIARAARPDVQTTALMGPVLYASGGMEALSTSTAAIRAALTPSGALSHLLYLHESPTVMSQANAVRRMYAEHVAHGGHAEVSMAPGSTGAVRVLELMHGV